MRLVNISLGSETSCYKMMKGKLSFGTQINQFVLVHATIFGNIRNSKV
jgi:hypothetical protein